MDNVFDELNQAVVAWVFIKKDKVMQAIEMPVVEINHQQQIHLQL